MNQIYIIGLGAGDLDQLPLGVYKTLKEAEHLYLRTKEHPVVEHFINEKITYSSFDDIYEKHDRFEAVYEEITEILLEKATHTSNHYLCCSWTSNGS